MSAPLGGVTLTVTVEFPDLRPQDVSDLLEAADALPFGHEELADALRTLADRVGRMLLTSLDRAHPRRRPR